ncbi:unnamed protein product [Peronospora belbahrii]|uniref:Uncharacterized protein n=1 Tax=Peronospora belbahrii TaxID=622444 RepID=A0ABN8D327_9STRA|nr:unnamed protein product [Peronospora belbahrii]
MFWTRPWAFLARLKTQGCHYWLDMFKALGLDKLLSLPFRDNPLNSTGYILASIYKQKWIDYFMKKRKLSREAAHRLGALCTSSNCGLQEGAMELTIPNPLCRTSLTLYVSWCYDPELCLQMTNGVLTNTDKFAKRMQQLNV